MKKAKPILVLLLKLLVSVGLLGYFLARIHIERFLQTFATAKLTITPLLTCCARAVCNWLRSRDSCACSHRSW